MPQQIFKTGLVNRLKQSVGINTSPTVFQHPIQQKANQELNDMLLRFADPLWIRFKIFFNFSASSGLLADGSNVNSAIAYFKRIGDTVRAEALKDWIDSLKNLSTNYSFLFEEITGLSELVSDNMQEMIPEDQKLDITFQETLDMKIANIIETYRHIVFNYERRVWVLPKNLRRFDMHIYVYPSGIYQISENEVEIAKYLFPTYQVSYKNSNKKSIRTVPENYLTGYVTVAPSSHNHIVYKCSECEILLTNSGSTFLSNVINSTSDVTKNLISIHPRFVTIDSIIASWWDTNTVASISFAALVSGQDSNGPAWKKALGDAMKDIGADAIMDLAAPFTSRARTALNNLGIDLNNPAESAASLGSRMIQDVGKSAANYLTQQEKKYINNFMYGNVYGFQPSSLTQIGSVNQISTTLQRNINRTQPTNEREVAKSVYQENPIPQPTGTQSRGNVYQKL